MSTHQQRSRSAFRTAAHTEWSYAPSAAFLSAIAIPFIGVLLFVRALLVLPSMSVVALASAAIIALAAWWMSSDRNDAGISLWGVSGASAFIAFAAGMLGDSRHVAEFRFVPAQLHERARKG